MLTFGIACFSWKKTSSCEVLNAFDSGILEVGALISVFAELEGGLCFVLYFFLQISRIFTAYEKESHCSVKVLAKCLIKQNSYFMFSDNRILLCREVRVP